MLKKGSRLYSILTGTCPRCHQESMYVDKNPLHLGNIYKMHERCGHCGLRYKIEPSFFFGAMYVSYGVGVALSIAAFIVSFFLFEAGLKTSFFIILGVLVITMPFNMRLSRNIWINVFIGYDKHWNDRLKP